MYVIKKGALMPQLPPLIPLDGVLKGESDRLLQKLLAVRGREGISEAKAQVGEETLNFTARYRPGGCKLDVFHQTGKKEETWVGRADFHVIKGFDGECVAVATRSTQENLFDVPFGRFRVSDENRREGSMKYSLLVTDDYRTESRGMKKIGWGGFARTLNMIRQVVAAEKYGAERLEVQAGNLLMHERLGIRWIIHPAFERLGEDFIQDHLGPIVFPSGENHLQALMGMALLNERRFDCMYSDWNFSLPDQMPNRMKFESELLAHPHTLGHTMDDLASTGARQVRGALVEAAGGWCNEQWDKFRLLPHDEMGRMKAVARQLQFTNGFYQLDDASVRNIRDNGVLRITHGIT